ncbi:sugar transferase [Kitasatospora gansuensis]
MLAVCALAVRVDTGPGVLFRQQRTGLDGKVFTLLKFRTLRPANEHESATHWNIAQDHRMSRVGHFLRHSSLDELPQLWNVLRGDMSLVGPRPERPYFVMRFSQAYPEYADRHRVPVGLTGLAQANGLRGDTSIEARARFDNRYIESWNLWLDVKLLFRTAALMLHPDGS